MSARLPAPRQSIALSDTRPVWTSLLIFLVPLMLSNILQSLGATANSIYLGRLIGVHALAAVSAIFPIVFFLIAFLIGIGSGSTVLIGQAYGARDHAKVKEIEAGYRKAQAEGIYPDDAEIRRQLDEMATASVIQE